jgi:hypothetical protein
MGITSEMAAPRNIVAPPQIGCANRILDNLLAVSNYAIQISGNWIFYAEKTHVQHHYSNPI